MAQAVANRVEVEELVMEQQAVTLVERQMEQLPELAVEADQTDPTMWEEAVELAVEEVMQVEAAVGAVIAMTAPVHTLALAVEAALEVQPELLQEEAVAHV